MTSSLVFLALPAYAQDMNFNRIASFQVGDNLPDAEETSAEIIAATADGMTLVYTDSPGAWIGFIDITDPNNPAALSAFMPEGEPTSVAVIGNYGLAGVYTSVSYTELSGYLVKNQRNDTERSWTLLSRKTFSGMPWSLQIPMLHGR